MVNKKYEIELEVLTPTSIGAGGEKEWVKGVDFIQKENKVYILSLRNMIKQGVDINQLSTYFANREDNQIATILGNNIERVSDKIFTSTITTANNIKTCTKNELSGLPIIPGSSLKGALRSVLFNHLRKNETKESEVFGSIKTGDEFMRFVKVSDFEFEKTELINTKIFNLRGSGEEWSGGWKHSQSGRNATTNKFSPTGFNTIYEAISPNSKGFGSIMFAEKQFKMLGVRNQKYGEQKNDLLNIQSIFKIINRHTKNYLNKQLDFFKAYPADESDKIIENIRYLINQIPNDNSHCVIKMAAGSGFHSITGDWQYDKDFINTGTWSFGRNIGKRKYKSRKIACNKDSMSLMGFVKIKITSDEEKEKEFHARKMKVEAERQRLEKIRLETEQLEKNKTLYVQLVNEAVELIDTGEYEEAKKKCSEASELFPKNQGHKNLLSTIDNQLQKIKREKEWELAKQKEAEEAIKRKQQQIEAGLSFLAEQYDDGRYKVADFKGAKNRINSWLRKANIEKLPEDEWEALTVNLKRIYDNLKPKDKKPWMKASDGVWRDVEKWVGKEEAIRIFDKTVQS